MKEKVDIEIEAFIHGAMCIAYSGRCTLSNHMTARDSNRGGCCQSCRWDYDLLEVDSDGDPEKVDIEIEAFIHGAMYRIFWSYLSNHMTARDSNRGGCCQSCRWDYDLLEARFIL